MATGNWGSTDLGGTIGTLHAGVKLRVAHWAGAPAGPGTVIVVQGRGTFMEVYGDTFAHLVREGFAVVAFDFRGQGGSDRRTRPGGHVSRFSDYVDDLQSVVRFAAQQGLPRPFFVLAESMGGLVALKAAPLLADQVERMVLVVPMLRIARLPAKEWLLSLATTLMCGVGLDKRAVAKPAGPPYEFLGNRATSDPDRYAALCELVDANPELACGPPTIGWLRAALRATGQIRRTVGKPLAVPTLFVAAGNDTVVSTPEISRFARATPGGGLVLIPNARHQLLIESDEHREPLFAAFRAFVRDVPRRLKKPRAVRGKLRFTPGEAPAAPIKVEVGGEAIPMPAPAEPAPAPAAVPEPPSEPVVETAAPKTAAAEPAESSTTVEATPDAPEPAAPPVAPTDGASEPPEEEDAPRSPREARRGQVLSERLRRRRHRRRVEPAAPPVDAAEPEAAPAPKPSAPPPATDAGPAEETAQGEPPTPTARLSDMFVDALPDALETPLDEPSSEMRGSDEAESDTLPDDGGSPEDEADSRTGERRIDRVRGLAAPPPRPVGRGGKAGGGRGTTRRR
ncbi:alpha/beta fold hydrolase [Acuticoccus mangrovi]|uniref:Alpha/beta hydrolase n=1 Tax=Acuticoccus mangrovi TaxID=2796142 RepID=A0A934IMQ6_9HYPH|nr:alpha/beta hydrolase [Acuticoccus mangrovi]